MIKQETDARVATCRQLVNSTRSIFKKEITTRVDRYQVAGYVAWNTMLKPGWVAPRIHHLKGTERL